MSILVDKKTRLVVQGITGGEGSFHTQQMIEYGTKVVAGVTPGKGGTEFLGIQVYNTVEQAEKNRKRIHPLFLYHLHLPLTPYLKPGKFRN